MPTNEECAALVSYLNAIRKISPLTHREERELAALAYSGHEEAKRHLILANLRVVTYVTKSLLGLGKPFRLLLQEGLQALFTAADHYDPASDLGFRAFAADHIQQTLMRSIAITSPDVTRPLRSLLDQVGIEIIERKDSEGMTQATQARTALPVKFLEEQGALHDLGFNAKKFLVLAFNGVLRIDQIATQLGLNTPIVNGYQGKVLEAFKPKWQAKEKAFTMDDLYLELQKTFKTWTPPATSTPKPPIKTVVKEAVVTAAPMAVVKDPEEVKLDKETNVEQEEVREVFASWKTFPITFLEREARVYKIASSNARKYLRYMFADGLSESQIVTKLCLPQATIERYRAELLNAFAVKDLGDLLGKLDIRYALQRAPEEAQVVPVSATSQSAYETPKEKPMVAVLSAPKVVPVVKSKDQPREEKYPLKFMKFLAVELGLTGDQEYILTQQIVYGQPMNVIKKHFFRVSEQVCYAMLVPPLRHAGFASKAAFSEKLPDLLAFFEKDRAAGWLKRAVQTFSVKEDVVIHEDSVELPLDVEQDDAETSKDAAAETLPTDLPEEPTIKEEAQEEIGVVPLAMVAEEPKEGSEMNGIISEASAAADAKPKAPKITIDERLELARGLINGWPKRGLPPGQPLDFMNDLAREIGFDDLQRCIIVEGESWLTSITDVSKKLHYASHGNCYSRLEPQLARAGFAGRTHLSSKLPALCTYWESDKKPGWLKRAMAPQPRKVTLKTVAPAEKPVTLPPISKEGSKAGTTPGFDLYPIDFMKSLCEEFRIDKKDKAYTILIGQHVYNKSNDDLVKTGMAHGTFGRAVVRVIKPFGFETKTQLTESLAALHQAYQQDSNPGWLQPALKKLGIKADKVVMQKPEDTVDAPVPESKEELVQALDVKKIRPRDKVFAAKQVASPIAERESNPTIIASRLGLYPIEFIDSLCDEFGMSKQENARVILVGQYVHSQTNEVIASHVGFAPGTMSSIVLRSIKSFGFKTKMELTIRMAELHKSYQKDASHGWLQPALKKLGIKASEANPQKQDDKVETPVLQRKEEFVQATNSQPAIEPVKEVNSKKDFSDTLLTDSQRGQANIKGVTEFLTSVDAEPMSVAYHDMGDKPVEWLQSLAASTGVTLTRDESVQIFAENLKPFAKEIASNSRFTVNEVLKELYMSAAKCGEYLMAVK